MSNPKGLKNRTFSQGTSDSQTLRQETLVTVDYEYVKISRFAVLNMKLSLTEEHTCLTFVPSDK